MLRSKTIRALCLYLAEDFCCLNYKMPAECEGLLHMRGHRQAHVVGPQSWGQADLVQGIGAGLGGYHSINNLNVIIDGLIECSGVVGIGG